jgi:hypothetical protein
MGLLDLLSHCQLETVFWDVSPYSLIKIDRRFGGVYCLHHQGVEFLQTVQRNIPADIFILSALRSSYLTDCQLAKKGFAPCSYLLQILTCIRGLFKFRILQTPPDRLARVVLTLNSLCATTSGNSRSHYLLVTRLSHHCIPESDSLATEVTASEPNINHLKPKLV